MFVPIPQQLAIQVSQDAVANARNTMGQWGWSNLSLQALQPMPGDGGRVGIQTTAKYLMYQERGIQPFLMWWVQGRSVPLSCKAGDGPHFRRGGHVGEPGYVSIPHVGQVWRAQRWRHPGLSGRHFMQDGLSQAIDDNIPAIKQWAASLLGGAAA